MNSNTIKAAFFDMDGVLFDSMKNHATSWKKAMADNDIKYEAYYSYLNEGRNAKGTINWAFNKTFNRDASSDEIEKIYEAKTHYMSMLPPPIILPKMQQLITSLFQKNIRIIIVTGSNQQQLIERIKNDFNINRSDIITGADVTIGKPNAEPYLKALSRSRVNSNEAVIIENAPLGIQSAKSANIFTIGVNTGILEDRILKEAGADIVLPSTIELFNQWQSIINSRNP